ncbi:hypothetical protein AKUA2003_PHAGE200090 (plasmid) [Apilactobacillus kunkeei]|nr:hypothetical protein AKUA2003_PHAGE200090 [Apilactobacillus kunkeei]CAI2670261.1 hypothetical protein AKUA1001_PHAGE200090 [Apilactobacillus kunkeei]CAI2803557.1 hypothetical protein AKUA2002_PHAGE200090 [Apilactobacillus kunkeei]
MTRLYDLENTYLKIQSMIENDDELLNDTLDSIDFKNDFEDKLVGYGKVVLNIKSDVEAIKAEEQRLHERRKRLENKVDYLQGRMLDAMKLVNVKAINDPILTIKLRNNKRVSILDETKISDKYLVPQQPKISKTDIRNDLKNGINVDGAELTEYTSLNIK